MGWRTAKMEASAKGIDKVLSIDAERHLSTDSARIRSHVRRCELTWNKYPPGSCLWGKSSMHAVLCKVTFGNELTLSLWCCPRICFNSDINWQLLLWLSSTSFVGLVKIYDCLLSLRFYDISAMLEFGCYYYCYWLFRHIGKIIRFLPIQLNKL